MKSEEFIAILAGYIVDQDGSRTEIYADIKSKLSLMCTQENDVYALSAKV